MQAVDERVLQMAEISDEARSDSKQAYLPPSVVDYGLLAKDAAVTSSGAGADGANNYS